MSTVFGAIDTAGSGLVVYRKWLDAVSDNIANINDVRATSGPAFQARYVVAQAKDYGRGGGVEVGGIELGKAEGRVSYQPDHPLADAQGMVRLPDIELSDQMTQLILAQRGYQANSRSITTADEILVETLSMKR